ncbi:MAG: hypothetical protein V1897_18575 [Pseudomonadota bacterium]
MTIPKFILWIVLLSALLIGCSPLNYIRGGLYRNLNEDLTIVSLTENPKKFLNKEIVFSVRYYKKSDLPSPLGDDYVNFIIADRVSYITLNKVWIKKEQAKVLDSLKEMETIVMKARVFKIDKEKDPNLEALEIVRE